MVLVGSWQQDTFNGFPDLNWGIAMNPAPAGETFHGTLGGWNMAIYDAAEHKDEAQKFYGRALARGLIIIPWVTPGVIAALVWRMMYDPQLGIINGTLIRLGLIEIGIPWLTQVSTVMPAVVTVAIWKGSSFSTVMYLAALQGVPEDLMDAARIDGAGAFQRLIHIIIPQIMPVVRVTVLLTVVATANYFDLIWIMTEGGPVNYTHIFPTFIYELAFSGAKTGMAAAYGLVVAGILLIFSLVYIRELNKRQALD